MLEFVKTLSFEQWGLLLGSIAAVGHFVLDRYKLSKVLNDAQRTKVNYFIVRVASVVAPALTVIATDPNFNALVHNYFPTMIAFFAAYQGLYVAVISTWRKVQSLQSALNAVTGPSVPETAPVLETTI